MVLHSKRKIQGRVKAELGSLCQGSPSSCSSVPSLGMGVAGQGLGLGSQPWVLCLDHWGWTGQGVLCIRARLLHVLLPFPQCYRRQMFVQESEMSLLWLGGGGHQGYPARSWSPTVWLQTPSHQWGAPRPGVSLSSAPRAPFPRFVFPGDVLFQMAEVHRQIQNQLEEMVSARRCCSTGAAPQPGLSNPLPAPPSPQI